MKGDSKQHLLDAVSVLMKPLAKLLIDNGVTHSDLSEVLKDVYVDSVVRHYDSGAKVNRSQIAVMTGLTRKEVKRVIDRALEEGDAKRSKSRPERVLSGWFNDPNFSGPYGVPLELPYEAGPDEKSFVQLVKTYGADMSPKATLEELKRGGCVAEVDGSIKAVRRDFHFAVLSAELIERFGEVIHKVLSTATFNLQKTEPEDGFFDRLVYAENGCTQEVVDRFNVYLKEYGQYFLEDIDRWFASNESKNRAGEPRKETGLYMVHYIEGPQETTSLAELLAEKGLTADSQNS